MWRPFRRKVKLEVADEVKTKQDRVKRLQEKWKTDRLWRGKNHTRFMRVRSPNETEDPRIIYCIGVPHKIPKPKGW